jgi:uncharacterized membrane protein YeaQ/YmgE (transglycosylase-associated protein family)
MDLLSLICFLLIGLVAGHLAGLIMKGKDFGLVPNMVVGVLGAILGGFLAGQLGLSSGNIIAQLIIATAGAVLLLFLIKLVKINM